MAEVALAWYQMADDARTASRGRVRRLAQELDLTTKRMMREGTGGYFRRAAETRISFQDEDAQEWEVFAQKVRATADYELFTMFGKPVAAGKMRRLGEVKLFLARRTAQGTVTGSERLKMLIAASASGAHREAAEKWQEMFQACYEELQGTTPVGTIRAIMREEIIQYAIPIGQHKAGIYYVFVEDLPRLAKLREFIEQTVEGGALITLPIEAGPDQHQMFADASDDHMETRIDQWHARMMEAYERNPVGRLLRPAKWIERLDTLDALIAMHERRLGWPLLRSRRRMDLARSTMAQIVPTADLQRVIN